MQLKELQEYLNDTSLDLYEMANVRPNRTGLKMTIYISPRMPSIKHGPRIKVSKHYGERVSSDFFSIAFNDKGIIEVVHKDTGNIKQLDVERVIEFVRINLVTLLDLWYDRIDSTDAVLQLKTV